MKKGLTEVEIDLILYAIISKAANEVRELQEFDIDEMWLSIERRLDEED